MSDFGRAADHEQVPESKSANVRAKRGEVLARVSYETEKIIFREGQDSTNAFVLESGRVGVFKTVDGKTMRLAVLEPGAMFGEMAAITGEPRAATTMALEPCVVVRIPKSTMQSKMAACDPFIRALLNILIDNLRRANERYVTTAKTAERLLLDLKKADSSSETTEEEPLELSNEMIVED